MLEPLANHLWQSTLFAIAVAALVPAFRHNRAQVRYWLWLAASLKFVVPFSALLWIGSQIELVPIQRSGQAYIGILDNAVAPFTPEPASRVDGRGRPMPPPPPSPLTAYAQRGVTILWPAGTITILLIWTVRWRRIAAAVREASPITDGPVLERLRRLEGDTPRLRLVMSAHAIEPGVFGIVRPVLLWPSGIDDRLSPEHIEAILAHEVAHARRRDNLAAIMHMAVEALFWFHPAVWWIGARLVDERERACDEDVVDRGTEPDVYAESILKVCRFYVESPLVCVAGVTGSNLEQRMEHIMRSTPHAAAGPLERLVLGAAMSAAIAIPVAIGIVTSPRVSAQIVAPGPDSPTFEVASIRPAAGRGRMGGAASPGRVELTGISGRRLIGQAYEIHDTQIIGGPDWLRTQGFDIIATNAGMTTLDARRMMMKTLLRDRFKLTFHIEKRDLPIYALVVQRGDGQLGPGLRRIGDEECPPPGSRGSGPGGPPPPAAFPFDPKAAARCGNIIGGPGRLIGHGVPLDMLARLLSNLPAISSFNRPVSNLTGLEGLYSFDFRFNNELGPVAPPPTGAPAASPNAITPGDEPGLFTALQEQLGLRLNAQRATLDVMVIDSIEQPTEN